MKRLSLLLLALLAPCITYADYVGGVGSSGGSQDVTVSACADCMAIVSVHFESDSVATSVTATLGGESLTSLCDANSGGGTSQSVSVFYADNTLLTTIGTGTKSLVSNVTATNPGGFSTVFTQFSGRSQSEPVCVTNGATTGTSISASVTALANDADVVSFVHNNNSGTAITIGGSQTQIYEGASGSDARGAAGYIQDATAGGYTPSYSIGSNTRWAVAGIVLEATGGGGGSANLPAIYRHLRQMKQ